MQIDQSLPGLQLDRPAHHDVKQTGGTVLLEVGDHGDGALSRGHRTLLLLAEQALIGERVLTSW